MPTSTTDAAAAPASDQSASPGSTSSTPSSSLSKLRLADQARLLQDNQRILDQSAANNKALVQQTLQLRAQQAGLASRELGASPPSSAVSQADESSMGNILIDSPTHHHYPPAATPSLPAVAASGLSTLGKIGAAAALTAGLGGAGGLGYLASALRQPVAAVAPATPTNTTNNNGFLIDLVPAKGP